MCIIFSNIYHVNMYICTLYIFISVIHILQTYHLFFGSPNLRDGSFSWSDFSGEMESLRPDILEQLPGVLNMGFSSSWVFRRIFQHIPGTYPRSPNQQVYEGNSLYFEIWGCLNYVLGVCWGSLGGLISSWIVWVKNVVYPPVLS